MAQSKIDDESKKIGPTFIYRNKNVAIWVKGYQRKIFAVLKGQREGLITISDVQRDCPPISESNILYEAFIFLHSHRFQTPNSTMESPNFFRGGGRGLSKGKTTSTYSQPGW